MLIFYHLLMELPCDGEGAIEKSPQRRSRHFSVLTHWKYALRAKMAAALLDEPFDKAQGMLF